MFFISIQFPFCSYSQDKKVNLKLHSFQINFSFITAFIWAPDKVCFLISIMPISSPNPMYDDLLESSHRDDSNKLSNIEFGEKITQVELIEVNFTHLIWTSALLKDNL